MKLNKDRTGEIRLSSGHTLITGHKPPLVDLKKFAEEIIGNDSIDIASFGLFEQATPNYATYYPEVSAEDLAPKEDEFIYPVFRMLSETIVSKGVPIDFSKPGVLKASMPMLLGQTINIDHEMAVGNAIGALSNVFWQNASKDAQGKKIPAGINAIMKIDGKSNPRIARGIMMNPPSIHSNSVTVKFGWEPSHKFETDGEFFEKAGTYNDKGELIRPVVNLIKAYHETSLVSHGADPYAQKIGTNGKIVNPEYASRVYSFSAGKPIQGCFEIDYKTENFSFSADKAIPNPINNISNNINQQNMDEIIKDVASEFGFKVEDLTEDNLVSKLKTKLEDTKNERSTEVENLKTEKTNLETELQAEKNKVIDLEKKEGLSESEKALITEITKNTRNEAVKFFKLIKGNEADENIINLISEASFETANAFLKQYSKEADDKFAATCQDCQSTNIVRATAKTSTDGLIGDGGETQGGGVKTSTEVRKSLKDKNKRKSLIFSRREN